MTSHPTPSSNLISVDRGALQMALNVLRRAGKDEVADALAASAVSPSQAQSGWKLVPIEPTPEMQEAALAASRAQGNVEGTSGPALPVGYELWCSAFVYRSMLKAAPAAGIQSPPAVRKLTDKQIEEIAGTDELTGDAILDFAHRLLNVASSVLEAAPVGGEVRELPEAVRVPLDELEADARYLAARLANGTMAPSVGAEAIQRRTRAIREALLAASSVLEAQPQPSEGGEKR